MPSVLSKYDSYLARMRGKYGNTFDPSDLAEQFIPYFDVGSRIKVHIRDEEIKYGTVGVTTGWKPVFLLMFNNRSIGSTATLHKDDIILAEKRGKPHRYYSVLPKVLTTTPKQETKHE